MRMTAFRIQNFRSILDSGWVTIKDIIGIVGKNEAGKTSLLKALWKFNPFKSEPYNLDREWPRGRRKERSAEKPVSTVRFEFNENERKEIVAIDPTSSGVTGVEITKLYSGKSLYTFLPKQISTQVWGRRLIAELKSSVPKTTSATLKTALASSLDEVERTCDNDDPPSAKKSLEGLKAKLASMASQDASEQQADKDALAQFAQPLNQVLSALAGQTPVQKAIEMTSGWLPKFIYMDDHKIFAGSAFLNQVKERKDRNQLSDEDRTTILIMEMAGLDLETEVTKGSQQDKEQRMLDMNDASQTLTNEIAERWRQKKYEIFFQADGQHFMTFVKDDGAKSLVPLEERSKGFQWFFSFDMTFMYETGGKFENAIILLDEPGLHLHAEAQRDLLERFKAYAASNQLIYTTHLPFMIDSRRLDNLWVSEERVDEGVKVHQDWGAADKDARFTLQAALGLSWSQSLYVGQYNLVVEGVTDYWFLTTLSTLMRDAGKSGIDEQLVITPAGGATKVAYVGTLLQGQSLNVAVLLDSDSEGQAAYQQLVHQWILDAENVLMVGQTLGQAGTLTLEDLFSEDYYLSQVSAAYSKELKNKTLKLAKEDAPILNRVEAALKKAGVERFNKGRVAKKIMADLASKNLADLDPSTVDSFAKVISALNARVESWKQQTAVTQQPVTRKPQVATRPPEARV